MKVLLVASTKKEIEFHKNKDIETFILGIGIPNTILNLTRKLTCEKYDLVINVGICGSFKKHLNIGDVVEVINDKFSELCYEDGAHINEFESSYEIDTSFSVKPKTNLNHVKAITVNTVHGNEDSISKIINRLNPDIETMEGAAVFMVCKYFKIKCMQIRAISNIVEKRNKEKWNIPLAIKNLSIELNKIITAL